MKIAILTGVVAAAVAFGVFFVKPVKTAQDAHAEWKRLAVETETKVRPAHFEKMKFDPSELEMRAPASKKK
jgi:hypothetical protein